MATLNVVSYHINVGVGDCAVHQLRSITGNEITVVSSVLVDGGSTEALKISGDTVQYLTGELEKNGVTRAIRYFDSRQDWKWANDSEMFLFDTIVLTHWDEDHYGGIAQALKEWINPNEPNNNLSWLKWDKNGRPATYFYCPNYYAVFSSSHGEKLNGLNTRYFSQRVNSLEQNIIGIKWKNEVIDFAILKTPDLDPHSNKLDWASCLGVNFFNNKGIKLKKDLSLKDLMKENPPINNGAGPAMYCIGLRGQSFPDYPFKSTSLAAPQVEAKTELEASNPGGKRPTVVADESHVTKTNKWSIATIIVWRVGGMDEFRCSHYSAGDATEGSEKSWLGWLKSNLESGSTPANITNVKLSHHGARSSTPLDFLQTFQPLNVVVSIPENKYLHPAWETVLYFASAAELASNRGTYGRKNKGLLPKMFSTKFPGYLKRKGNTFPVLDETKWQEGSFDPNGTTAAIAFQNKLDEDAGKKFSLFGNLMNSVWGNYKTRSVNTRSAWLIGEVLTKWEKFCYPDTAKKEVDFIAFVSSIDPDDDGIAWTKTFKQDKPQREKHAEFVKGLFPKPFKLLLQGVTLTGAVLQEVQVFVPTRAQLLVSDPSFDGVLPVVKADGSAEWGLTFDNQVDANDPASIYGTNFNESFVKADYSGGSKQTSRTDDPKPVTRGMPAVGPGPVLPGDGLGDEPLYGWYFYAASISNEAAKGLDIKYVRLGADNPEFDWFINSLHTALISLEKDPTADDNQDSLFELHKRDELVYWFRAALGADSLSLVLNKNVSKTGQLIGGFEFLMPIRSTDPFVALKFTTNRDVLMKSFGFTSTNDWTAAGMGNYGLRAGSTALLFALETQLVKDNAPVSLTLLDVAMFVGRDDLFTDGWLKFLGGLRLRFPDIDSLDDKLNGRNAVWFVPQLAYRTVARLQLQIAPEAQKDIKDFLRSALGNHVDQIDLNKCFVVGRLETDYSVNLNTTAGGFGVISKGSLGLILTVPILSVNFTATVEFNEEVVKLSLTSDDNTGKAINSLCTWLHEKTGVPLDDLKMTSWFKDRAGGMKIAAWQFRRVSVELTEASTSGSSSTDTGKISLSHFSIDLELRLDVNEQTSLLFLITYGYVAGSGSFLENSSLNGKLWFGTDDYRSNKALWILPYFEPYHYLTPVTINKAPAYLDLSTIQGFDQLPSWVPTMVTQAKIHLDKTNLTFTGTMRGKIPDASKSQVPTFIIDEINLFATYTFGQNVAGAGFSAVLAVSALLWPPAASGEETEQNAPAELSGALFYDKGAWGMTASIENLTGDCITKFFDESVQPAVGSVLKHIRIELLTASYTYESKDAKELNVTGILLIDQFALSIGYTHKGTKDWFFNASFSRDHPSSKTAVSTVGDIIKDITGSLPDLLDIFSQIKFDFSSSKDSKDTVGFYMASTEAKTNIKVMDNNHRLFLTAYIQFGGLLTQFIQIRALSPPAGKENDAQAQPETKRILVTALQSLPAVEVPVVGNVTQPFDEILLLWVQSTTGITKEELDMTNTFLATDELKMKSLPFKQTTKGPPTPQTIVLTPGLHLMLVLKDLQGQSQCVLDYSFSGKQQQKSFIALPLPQPDPNTIQTKALVLADDPPPDKPSGMAAYPKTIGPLAISNLGFGFSNNILSIKVDANVTLGPIAFSLIGFALTFNFSDKPAPDKPWSLHNLPSPGFDLSGLAIAYDKAPLVIAGTLIRSNELYQGAIAAGFNPWEFSAAGCYGKVSPPLVPKEFKTAFIYCRLKGPLLTMAYAEINGVTAGFGYNSSLRLPRAEEVVKFPLLDGGGGRETDAAKIQNALFTADVKWVMPKEGSFWIAAGMTVKAFKMLTIQAVVVVEWDPAVKLGLFAIASASVPALPNPKIRFAYVELAIAAVVDFGAGTMKIDGQLTPASFVLHPDCHLTGGFALYSWFGGPNTHRAANEVNVENGWVFTLGGYHSAFHAPPQFPKPPRLGINWDLGLIKLRGDAYFAITPKVCMGGGMWSVTLGKGALSAFYTAYVDFLINFQPFHFIADGGLAVGVRFTLNLWLVTIHISVDIAASLHIEGPPVHGTVHVDFWVFGFDVDFGDSSVPRPPPLKLLEFIELACQTGQGATEGVQALPAGSSSEQSRITEVTEDAWDDSKAFVLAVESGLVPSSNVESTPSGGNWTVRCSVFSFTVTCKLALQNANIVTPRPGKGDFTFTIEGAKDDKQQPIPINAKPMNLDVPLTTSTITVTIKPDENHPMFLKLADDGSVPLWDQNEGITTSLPTGLWGKYDPNADPTTQANNPALLDGTSATSLPLLNTVRISRPNDKPCTLDTLKPYPYRELMLQQISPVRTFPPLSPENGSYLPDTPDTVPVDEKGNPTRKSEQWSWVRQAWEKQTWKDEEVGKTVDAWKVFALGSMAWDEEKVKDEGGEMEWTRPARLVRDLESRYVRAPMISVKVA